MEDFSRYSSRAPRNFEQRSFRTRSGEELREDFDSFNDDEMSSYNAPLHDPREHEFKEQFPLPISEEEEDIIVKPKKVVEQEFDRPIRKKAKKTPAKVSYLGLFEWRSLSAQEKITKVGWVFCAFLCLRLFFMNAGIIDYVKMEKRLEAKEAELNSILGANRALEEEITMIKENVAYQKKLVRDYIGAIDENEYLILFPKETAN